MSFLLCKYFGQFPKLYIIATVAVETFGFIKTFVEPCKTKKRTGFFQDCTFSTNAVVFKFSRQMAIYWLQSSLSAILTL